MKWSGGWVGCPLPPPPPLKECSFPIRYLLVRYLISHIPLHAQLPMGCYFLVFYPCISLQSDGNIWQLCLQHNPVFLGVGVGEGVGGRGGKGLSQNEEQQTARKKSC